MISALQDRINTNYALRLAMQCIYCQNFIPGVQCIWERDLDETALCKMQQPRVPSGSCVGASAPSPAVTVPEKERE